MKRGAISILILLLVLLSGVAALPAAAQSGGIWAAQYYANPNLTGLPAFTISEASPTHDWGAGSPGTGISADFFSVIWTSTQTLAAGTYQLTVRADDGVMVFIDGVNYINEWHPSPGQTYNTTLNLGSGQHTFYIQYYEGGGNAFLHYNFVQVLNQPTQATATVQASLLNVRSGPGPSTTILTRIGRGQTYPVIGRLADNSWLQLNVNGVTGWVNAFYVTAANLQNVPVTGSPPGNNVCAGLASRLGVGSQARVLPGLPNNVRATPSTSAALVGTLPGGSVFSVTGGPTCAEGILWWQIYANGLVGWTGEGQGGAYWVEPAGSTSYGTATVTAYYLNVRSAPNAFASILTRIARGETYNVVGRNAVSSWLQLNVNGVIGWVNARYVSAINLGSVPVTG